VVTGGGLFVNAPLEVRLVAVTQLNMRLPSVPNVH
jgi:hypothetical protein